MRYLKWLLLAAVISGSSLALADQKTTGSLAITPHDVQLYTELYKASVMRDFIFSNQPDPLKSACEEACLEAQFAVRAEKENITSTSELADTIRRGEEYAIADAWLRSEIPPASDIQIQNYYIEHKHDFMRPAQVTFHHLFLLVPPGDENAEKSKGELARQLSTRAQSNDKFESIILQHSELESAKTDGGKVGPVNLEKLNPAIRSAIVRLQPGQISDAIRSPYGWEVIRLDNRSSETLLTLEEARPRIAEALFITNAGRLRETASASLSTSYPVQVYNEVLKQPEPASESILASVAGYPITLGETSKTVQLVNPFPESRNIRDQIRKYLPQVVLAKQIQLAAMDKKLTETADFKLKKFFIRNRAFTQAYFKHYVSERKPTEKDISDAYQAEKEVFRGPPYAKGILYRWSLPAKDSRSSTTAADIYLQTVLMDAISSLTTQVSNGSLTTEALSARADETTHLDWFREGPMGYHHDMAWFKTEPGRFTKPYVERGSIFVGYVEARRKPEQFPLEKVHDQVRRRLIGQWTEQERKAVINELLTNCGCS